MTTIDFNQRLTTNFTLSEFTDWANNVTMSASDREFALRICREKFNPEMIGEFRHLARSLQFIRDLCNMHFPQYNGSIRIRITSGFRPIEWERRRGRNGSSQHTICAADFVAIIPNGTQGDVNRVMSFIWSLVQNWEGGYARALRNNNYAFIHLDYGRRRTWIY